MDRRNFIRLSGLTGGGLMMSTFIPGKQLFGKEFNGVWEPNLHLRIAADNQVTLISTQYEIGQGTTTGMAQILADELGLDWNTLQIELAPGDPEKYGMWHGSGGSNGLSNNWLPLRETGAAVREVLVEVAAKRWEVSKAECKTENSQVVHTASQRRLSFGELASEASQMNLPERPRLKSMSEYKLIGRPVTGLKQTKIVAGKTLFSLDMKVPNMAYAVIERSPVFGGKVRSFDDTEARKLKGVVNIFSYDGTAQSRENGYWGGVRAGVVVVAESTWQAIQARKVLKVAWDLGENQNRGVSDITNELLAAVQVPKERTTTIGKPDDHLNSDGERFHFQYLNGYQSNICMEPLNALADVKADSAEIWVGTQAPGIEHVRLARLLNLSEKNIVVHAQPSGGGFGRRFFSDYTEEAALTSQKVGRPVKLMWTREDTVATNRYHDQYLQDWTAVIDENKKLSAVEYKGHLTGISAYRALTYTFPNFGMTPIRPAKRINGHVSWRSVAAHQWMWGLESFMDEMAHKTGKDPVEFRLKHLVDEDIVNIKQGQTMEDLYPARLKECIRVAAKEAKWGKKQKKGHGQGIASGSYNASYCAVVADVEVKSGRLIIHKMTTSIDCGTVVNPSQVKSQIEGGIVWGLSALFAEIEIENGRTKQSNYHDYPILRMSETPEIAVHIIESDYVPTGTGEPSVPVTAPAVLNAVFAATGKRLRRIPFDSAELA